MDEHNSRNDTNINEDAAGLDPAELARRFDALTDGLRHTPEQQSARQDPSPGQQQTPAAAAPSAPGDFEREFRRAHGASAEPEPAHEKKATQTAYASPAHPAEASTSQQEAPTAAHRPAPPDTDDVPLTLDALFSDEGIDARAEQRRERRSGSMERESSERTGRRAAAAAATHERGRGREKDMAKTAKAKSRKKKNKKRETLAGKIIKWAASVIVVLVIVAGVIGTVYVYGIIKDVPRYDPEDIQASLKVMSTMYDDQGQPMKNIYLPEGQRTLVTYQQLPDNFVNALIAIEDKTFWTHKGFNIIRMGGAIIESMRGGGDISGTSTISQQLARNIWLFEERTTRSYERKIKEAFYARELEKNLSKQEILTAYLNTIALGNHSYGIEAAAENYFGKKVEQLDLIESAALAALPKAPSEYAMIITVAPGEVAPDDPRILLVGSQYIYLYNAAIEPRLELVLSEMNAQGYITDAQYKAVSNDKIRSHLRPKEIEASTNADFFVSYAIDNIADDLLKYDVEVASRDEAIQKIYSGGLDIYTTFNQRAQDIVTQEFGDPENFPKAQLTQIDRNGNLLDDRGDIVLFNYDYVFQEREDGLWFHLIYDEDETKSDYTWGDDGSMLIFSGPDRRLGVYRTAGAGGPDINLELKDFYTTPEGVLYMTKGGIISIPTEYKGMDSGGNLILSKKFFDSPYNIFTTDEDGGIWISHKHFTLRQEILQPQAAFVLIDHTNGQLKAMVGGRGIKGQFQYNRTIAPRQPGSTIKPIGVYAPAIEMTANGEQVGSDIPTYGTYWSPVSIIIDEEMEYRGRVWPKNWYSGYRGPLTMRNSIENSINVNAVKVQLAIGDQRSINFLKKLGITTIVEEGASNDLAPAALALGGMTKGISPIELASAYGTFASAGKRVTPITYTLVKNKRGQVLLDGGTESMQVMDPGTAFIMNDMLRTTITNGIATAAAVSGTSIAGKTGTTSDNFDAWFVGNTPKYSAAVWIGCDVSVRLSQGSSASARLFSRLMSQIIEGEDQGEYPPQPENVILATVSTKPMSNPDSAKSFTDFFFEGTVPQFLDLGIEEFDVCTESHYLATPWCPSHEMRQYSTINKSVNDEIQTPEAPEYYCYLHNLDPQLFPPNPAEQFNFDFGKATVPNLVGKKLSEAKKALKNAGLKIGEVFTDPNYSSAPKNVVVSQNPQEGVKLPEGSVVNVTVSKGPKPPQKPPEEPDEPDEIDGAMARTTTAATAEAADTKRTPPAMPATPFGIEFIKWYYSSLLSNVAS